VNRRFLRTVTLGVLLASLLITLAACSSHVQSTPEMAQASREDFLYAMRWKRLPMASALMQKELRADFMASFAKLKGLHVTDLRIVDLKTTPAGRQFDVSIEMDYFIDPSVTLKTFSFEQSWQYFEAGESSPPGFRIVTPFPPFP
jgi:hypothetical protein